MARNGHTRAVRHTRAIRATRASLAALGSLTLLATTVASVALVAVAVPPAAASNWAPVHAGDFPDPSVMEWGGVYYGFSTQNFAAPAQLINIQVSTSLDGVHWTALNGVDALPQLPPWAQSGDTWAPSVVRDNTDNDFVMYYSAIDNGENGDHCIGMATSVTPLGPYTDTNSQPVMCQTGLGGSIDPNVFTDNAGNSWLIWKIDGNNVGAPNTQIWSVPLTAHMTIVQGVQPVVLLQNNPSSWQGPIIEGPDMYETPGGNYYLFYSGSDVGSAAYAIGWASCPSGPAAPCTDESAGAPLLASQPGMSGPGGPDVYTLPPAVGQSTGQTVLAFAAWQGTTIGYFTCGIRPMYLADVTFGPGGGPPSVSPQNPFEAAATGPVCPQPPTPAPGYWQVASDGGVFTFGSAGFFGSTGSMRLNRPVVGMAVTPDHQGYWLVASDGGVFAFGDAGFYGSTGSIRLNKPIIGMIPTLDGRGYWLVASDGGVFAFGDAPFYGSAGSSNVTYPITAAAPSYLDGGYWMVDADGQVFSFGDARYEGAPYGAPGGYQITGMAGSHSSNGYWLASQNGNVASFGDATPYGSMVGTPLNAPVVGMSGTFDGAGYWLQGSDGGIFTFGDAPFLGSMGGQHLNAPMVGIAGI
jgi:Glycosyl hydrolases family 43